MLDLVRHPHWQRDLLRYLAGVANKRVVIGTYDCVIFSAGAVHAMTGWYPDPSVFAYRTIAQGHGLLEELGHADLSAYLDLHFQSQPPAFARPGDLVLVASDQGEALGIMQGEMIYLVGPNGMGVYPLANALSSWRVG